ncbi:aspartic peptidase domain-containing protein [Mycena albidolilacea]|uniref:Aspartic peptidase domain-containing protein n=1 Tax=Mycena albidolilacea TaxID=1033008 RepID=A0AAD6ZF77_9AGAR|nr:aspartic peptidase domain-containing protein [Mycena albidolilacea]
MVLDTGSGDIWVGGVPCSDPCSSSLYNPSASSTAVNVSTALVKIAENGESVSGYRFSSASTSASTPSRIQNSVMQSETIDPALVPTACSGSLGMAFVGVSQTSTDPFFQILLGGEQPTAPEFGLWLTRAPVAQQMTESPGGTFTLGGTNSSLYSGQIEFLNLTGAALTYWMLNISGITVQGKAINIVQNTTLAAFDTSFRFISGTADDMRQFGRRFQVRHSSVNPMNIISVPCTTDVNVTVSFGGRSWPISAADINLGPANNSDQACIGAIRPYVDADGPSSDWVFGTPFLRNVYSVFRSNSPASIGFAELSSIAGGSGTSSSGNSSSGSSTSTPGPSTTPASTNSGTNGTSKKPHKISAIVGTALGVITGLLFIGLIVFWYRGRNRQNTRNFLPPPFSSRTPHTESSGLPTPYPATEPSLSPESLCNSEKLETLSPLRMPHRSPGPPIATDVTTSSPTAQSTGGSDTPVPPGAQSVNSPTEHMILQALEDLREEVRWLAAERMHPERPPSYVTAKKNDSNEVGRELFIQTPPQFPCSN